MFKLARNPFYIYVAGFILAFLIYSLDWSELYPDISADVKWFFAVTFLIFIALGLFSDNYKLIRRAPSRTQIRFLSRLTAGLFVLYALEMAAERDLPLLSILLGRPGIDYREFGLPLLHGILTSFNSFLIAHAFSTYMSQKSGGALRIYLLLYLPALLMVNRSIIFFGLITTVFIYLHYLKRVRAGTQVKLAILILIGLFAFGWIGNLRSGGDYIYEQSRATEEFMESGIPREYYWTYLYAASPLANFQNTINKRHNTDPDIAGFLFYENLPRAISKGLGESLGLNRIELARIVPWLTVGTAYARSFAYIGWYGPYLLFFIHLALYLVFLLLVPPRSSYHVTAVSVLSVIVLLNIFTNMLIVTGISFQLAYCVLFAFFEGKRLVWNPAGPDRDGEATQSTV